MERVKKIILVSVVLVMLLSFTACDVITKVLENTTSPEDEAVSYSLPSEYTEENQKITEGESVENDVDISEDHTEETEEIPEVKRPEITPYPALFDVSLSAVSSDVKDFLGDYIDEFSHFAAALNACTDSFTFTSEEAMNRILSVSSVLPCSDYISTYDINYDSFTVSPVYNTDTSVIGTELVNIKDAIGAFLSGNINEEATDFEKLLLVYEFMAVTELDYNKNSISSVMTEGYGSDYAVARAFSLVLSQLGIDSRIISTVVGVNDELHYLTAANIGGKFYAFDPVLENRLNKGKGLDYFMMSSSGANTKGLGAFYSGENGFFSADFTLSIDTSKDNAFSGTDKWSLDGNSHILYMCKNGSEVFTDSFNTFSLEEIEG